MGNTIKNIHLINLCFYKPLMTISNLSSQHISRFFTLYKQIATESFEEWSTESKQHWFSVDYSPQAWKEMLQNKYPIFVASQGKTFVGFSAIESIDYGVAYLGWIGVLKSHQKQGIGDTLMKQTIDWAQKEPKIHKIELETQIQALQPFYEKHGFTLEGIRKKSWQMLDNYMFGKIL